MTRFALIASLLLVLAGCSAAGAIIQVASDAAGLVVPWHPDDQR